MDFEWGAGAEIATSPSDSPLVPESLWAHVVDKSPAGVVIVDSAGEVIFASNAIRSILGAEELALTKSLDWIADPKDVGRLRDFVKHAHVRPGTDELRLRARTESGLKHLRLTSISVDDPTTLDGAIVCITDETESHKLERRTENLTSKDPVTMLRNRSSYVALLEQALVRKATLRGRICIAVVNIDDFHLINEGYGIEIGDLVLCEIAMRITKELGEETPVARLAGDEFGVIFEPGSTEVGARRITDKLLEALSPPIEIGTYRISVRASAGIASSSEVNHDAKKLLRAAGAALRSAKKSSRGHVVEFCETMGQQVLEHASVHRQFHTALTDRKLRLVYQPIMDMQTGQIVSVEALSRWTDPYLGPVSPTVFIPIAEATNLIGKLGDWVIESVCEQINLWAAMGINGFTVSVNVSGQQLLEPETAEDLISIVRAHGVAPERIVIEITESVLIDDTNLVNERLRTLRGFGFQLAVDDFGTGYSSLSYLREYEFDILKIDRAFTNPLRQQSNDRDWLIVGSVIELARALGIKTVAEGIEHENEFMSLCQLGCNYGQGYLFWEPLEVETANAVLAEPTVRAVA